MKIDISQESEKEIKIIIDKFISTGYEQIDTQAIERKIKFDNEKKTIYLVFYPELLMYEDKIIPWICTELQDDENLKNEDYAIEIAKFIIKEFEKINIGIFMDEDAFMQHFTKEKYSLKCYFNLDYPEGYWRNHTL